MAAIALFTLCEIFGTEVVIINRTEDLTYEENLAQDVLEIITVFSARLYGSRSHKNRQIIKELFPGSRPNQMKSFKTELNLNNCQKTLMAKHAGVARHAYNWGLATCIEAHKNEEKRPSAITLHKRLVREVKSECPWYYEVSKCAPQKALRDLERAFLNFFKINGRGFPKFKKKGRNDRFYLEGSIKISGNRIKLPRIGWVKTYEKHLPPILVKSTSNATISLKAGRWFIAYKVDVDPQPVTHPNGCVGVDLGIKTLATLSNGKTFPAVKPYRKAKKRLASKQRSVSRKVKGSNNRSICGSAFS